MSVFVLDKKKRPLMPTSEKDAASVNSTRWKLAERLKATGLPVELASGRKTKWNRSRLSIPKTHSLDALCVGDVGIIANWNIPTLEIKCTGRGSYKRTLSNKYGFPRAHLMRQKTVAGFQTGDLVKAIVTQGKKKQEHT